MRQMLVSRSELGVSQVPWRLNPAGKRSQDLSNSPGAGWGSGSSSAHLQAWGIQGAPGGHLPLTALFSLWPEVLLGKGSRRGEAGELWVGGTVGRGLRGGPSCQPGKGVARSHSFQSALCWSAPHSKQGTLCSTDRNTHTHTCTHIPWPSSHPLFFPPF